MRGRALAASAVALAWLALLVAPWVGCGPARGSIGARPWREAPIAGWIYTVAFVGGGVLCLALGGWVLAGIVRASRVPEGLLLSKAVFVAPPSSREEGSSSSLDELAPKTSIYDPLVPPAGLGVAPHPDAPARSAQERGALVRMVSEVSFAPSSTAIADDASSTASSDSILFAKGTEQRKNNSAMRHVAHLREQMHAERRERRASLDLSERRALPGSPTPSQRRNSVATHAALRALFGDDSDDDSKPLRPDATCVARAEGSSSGP